MANRFWVGGTGTWDASNTTNWSTTSGGAGGASVPSTGDDALFNANSGVGTVTLGYSPTVQSIDMNGYTGTFDGVGSSYTITLNSTSRIWRATASVTLLGSPNLTTTNTSTSPYQIDGGGKVYGNLVIGGATGISTLTINGVNTFSELASTKTVAHTINFTANQTITTWSVTGSSGNIVEVTSNAVATPRTLTITNRTSGINYLNVLAIISNLSPVTFYAGANSNLVAGSIGVAAIAPTTDEFIYVLNTGTSFTVPADWNNSNNEIHLFSGGGGGAGSRFTTPNGSGGAGGGGGGYTKVTNLTLTPSSSVSYAIGAGGASGASGANGTTGGNTTFNAGAYTTTGGGGAQGTATTSTGGAAGTGATNNGGVGGVGSLSIVASTGNGGGGGAGAGGPLGTGANGGNGFASTTTANIASGGGGGNGGGSIGGNASSATGGAGGNNNAGVGSSIASFNGAGCSGRAGTSSSFRSGSGIDIVKAGLGGGGGGAGSPAVNNDSVGGIFGGGGGGGGLTTSNLTRSGAAGGQGGIIIVYNAGAAPVSNSNFFLMFG